MKILFAAVLLSANIFAQTGPGYQPKHIKHHDRVSHDNKRIDRQEKRIATEHRDGQITHAQAVQDRENLKNINHEKNAMRRTDGGHLSKGDQAALNQQLNQNSKAIGK